MNIGLTGSSGILGTKLKKMLKLKKKNFFLGKIENSNHVNNWIKSNSFDHIIHLAAIVPTKTVNKNKNKSMKVNYEGTKNLVDAINKYSKKKIWFFYSSTSHVYKAKKTIISESSKKYPISYYGFTKLKGEEYIIKNQKKIIICIGRIFSFTSKNQDKNFLIPKIITNLKRNKKKIYFKNLNHNRDFLSIEEISLAIINLLNKNSKGIFNICSGKKINLIDILKTLNKKYKKNVFINNKSDKEATTLYGSNKKLVNLGWRPNECSYLDYLYKNY